MIMSCLFKGGKKPVVINHFIYFVAQEVVEGDRS
jgi:hypothetical protein